MKTEADALVPYQQPATPTIAYGDLERMAAAVAKSGLFGLRTPEQALALMLIAQAEGLHPVEAARDYDIIQGRPAKKTEAMQRSFLTAGGIIEWHRLDDTVAEATFKHPRGGSVRINWDLDRAKRAGLAEKDNWRKFPRQMLRSRCVSEGIRTVWPLASGGMHAPEELDFTEVRDVTPAPPAAAAPAQGESGRPKVLDKVAGQAPATAQAPAASQAPAANHHPQNGKAKRGPDTAAELLKKMEGATTLDELDQLGSQAEAFKDTEDFELLKDMFVLRTKQLKRALRNQTPEAKAASMGFQSADPAAPAAAEPEPSKELVQSQFPQDVI